MISVTLPVLLEARRIRRGSSNGELLWIFPLLGTGVGVGTRDAMCFVGICTAAAAEGESCRDVYDDYLNAFWQFYRKILRLGRTTYLLSLRTSGRGHFVQGLAPLEHVMSVGWTRLRT